MNGPDPRNGHPMDGFPRVCFIKNTVSNPNIVIGDYTYYDDPDDSENFERNVLYHYPFIGDGAIIAARSVVASDVSPYTFVGGNPVKPIKQRFPENIITALLGIAWWDWPVEKVTANLQYIISADIETLLAVK